MPLVPLHNEKELLRAVAEGDQQAFARLFNAYCNPLGEYIYRLTESPETTEEILQDVFLEVWQKREVLTGQPQENDGPEKWEGISWMTEP